MSLRQSLILLISLLTAFIYYSWLSTSVYPPYVASFDEYGYIGQAWIFSEGKLGIVPGRFHGGLLEPHVLYRDGILSSKYPPGFPLALAGFMLLDIELLANPLFTALSLLFTFLIMRRFVGFNLAMLVTIFAAFNPYTFGYAASLFSQPLALLLSMGALWAFTCYQENPRKKYLYMMGGFCAYGLFTRPMDFIALLAAINISLLVLNKPKLAARPIITICLTAFVGVIIQIMYSSYHRNEFAVSIYSNVFSSILYIMPEEEGGFVNALQVSAHQYLKNAKVMLVYLFKNKFMYIIGTMNIALFMLGLAVTLRKKIFCVFILYIIFLVGIYNFHRTDGWAQYGARYWYPLLGSFMIIAAMSWSLLVSAANKYAGKYARHTQLGLACILIFFEAFWLIKTNPSTLNSYRVRFELLKNARENMESICPEKTAVILLYRDVHYSRAMNKYVQDILLKTNSFSERKRLFFGPFANVKIDENPESFDRFLGTIKAVYPDYPICYYKVDYRPPSKN